MNLRRPILLAFLFLTGRIALGQNDFYFNQFATIRYLSNPAELSFNKQNGIYLFRRDQWLNSPVKSSHLSILTGQYNLNRNVDLGLALSQYNSGNVFSNNSLQGLASWKGRIDKRSNRYFSIGTNLRLGSTRADYSNTLLTDLNDPSIPQTVISQFFWDIGIGGNFKYDGFNIGVSAFSLKAFNSQFTSNYLYSRSILYNIGYNFNEALNAKSFNRPILMLRIRAVDNAFAQGEFILDQRIFSNTSYKLLAGLGIRRDLTNGLYNSIIIHLGIFWGTKTRLAFGFGPETFAAPVNTASSGNMEYLFGAEQTTKSDQFYVYYNAAKSELYQTNWTAAKSAFYNAQQLFPDDKEVSEQIHLSEELEIKWQSIEQSTALANDQIKNQNTILTKQTCEQTLKLIELFDSIAKKQVNPELISAKTSEIKLLLDQNNQLANAMARFEQAEKLQQQKSFSEAITQFNEAKKHFNPTDCEMHIQQCQEGIAIEKEEKKRLEALQLELDIASAYNSREYESCIKLATEYLAKFPYNSESVADIKNNSVAAIAYREKQEKATRVSNHYLAAKKLDKEEKLKEALTEILLAINEDQTCDSCKVYQQYLESRWKVVRDSAYQKHIEKGDYFFSIRAYKQAIAEYLKATDLNDTEEVTLKIEDCEIQMGQTSSANISSMQTIYNKCSESVVLVYSKNTDTKLEVFGTGFFIRPDGTGITNYHVIEGCNEIFINTSKEKMFAVDILKYNKEEDWAIFRIGIQDVVKYPYLKFASNQPRIGEKVYSIGYPLVDLVYGITGEINSTISEGNVNSAPTARVIQNSCEINHGNSGGPLLNSRGEVVGITTWGLKADESGNLKYAINIQSLPSVYIQN